MANETMQKAPRRYEKMRDSGVEWIGMAPEEWEIFMVGQLTTQVKDKNVALQETNLLSLSYGKIKRKSINTTEGLLPASFDNYNIIEAGDVVLRLTDLQNDQTSLRVGLATEKGIITSAYLTIRPQRAVWPNFLYYALHSFDIRKGFYGMGAGVRQGLKFDEVRQIRVVVPSLKAQKSIVSYLEKKCNAIDGIVAEVKASIEEYKAWKSSIIYEAVTKGLDPNAEMKDSGVEWIGYIPAHWKVSRIKNEFENHDEWREPISAENREKRLRLYDYYGASGVIDKIDSFNVDATVLLIGEDGANLRMRNLPLVYKAYGKFWVNNHAHILVVKEPNFYDFMAYLLEAGDYNPFITGSAQPKLTQSNLMIFPIPVAPPTEQMRIAEFLNNRCQQIDALILEKQSLISDLESYKKSLIYEVVTGKRKVV